MGSCEKFGQESGSFSLQGQMLVAMPGMKDPNFERSVIYLCLHNEEGALGLIVNRRLPNVGLPHLLGPLGLEGGKASASLPIYMGGPVEMGRGLVLHSSDYQVPEVTTLVSSEIGLTGTVDILKAIAEGSGPTRALLALGYAGWGPGQLEQEIQTHGWLHTGADADLIFSSDAVEEKYGRAMAKIGIDAGFLSSQTGQG